MLALGRSDAPAGASPRTSERLASTARAVAAGRFPIGLDSTRRAVLLYVATVPWTSDFRRFLQEHAPLLQLLLAWTLRLVFVQPNDRWSDSYQGVINEELKTPLQPATISELKKCIATVMVHLKEQDSKIQNVSDQIQINKGGLEVTANDLSGVKSNTSSQ